MDEAKLIEKLRRIEALYAGAATSGERDAAGNARERILERLARATREDPPGEYTFRLADPWSRRVFVALLRRYGIEPYRYKGQRRTTVVARASKAFVEETLWPEFEEIAKTLRDYLDEVTGRVIESSIHGDGSEVRVVENGGSLPPGS